MKNKRKNKKKKDVFVLYINDINDYLYIYNFTMNLLEGIL